ncbi:MAG: hypothetical protein J0L64_28010 [Acidobacteria bacterium]|nr:hypothetical protein [Acidobacteriota bacterium]
MAKNRLSNRAARRAAQQQAQQQAQRSTSQPATTPAAQTSAPPAQPAPPNPADPIEAAAQLLAAEYCAKGSIELYFCRKIASAEITYNSLQNSINTLTDETDPDARTRDRLTRAQSRVLRNQTTALKELKALQDRRNLIERFPAQTKDCLPLADHTPFVGDAPKIRALHPILNGKLRSPKDHTPVKNTPAAKRTPPDVMSDLEALLSSTL